MTASTVADHPADRLAELSNDNMFGTPVDHRQDRDQLDQLPTSLVGCFGGTDAGILRPDTHPRSIIRT